MSVSLHNIQGYGRNTRRNANESVSDQSVSEVESYGIKVFNICPYGIASGNSPEKHYRKNSPYMDMVSKILKVLPEKIAEKIQRKIFKLD